MSDSTEETVKPGDVRAASKPSWDSLRNSALPPLLQGLAPELPLDEGIAQLRNERARWRLAWRPYAEDLKAVVEHMRSAEETTDANALLYEDIIDSIEDDIEEVLAHNDDVAGHKQIPSDNTSRHTHSYLKWSAVKLAAKQSELEELLGGGPVKAWGHSPLASRKFGENYPSDTFREILHYRPQAPVPTRFWTSTRTWLLSYALASLAMTALVSTGIYWTAKGGHEVWARTPAHMNESWTSRVSSVTATAFQATPGVVFSSSEPLSRSGGAPLYFKVAGTMKIFDATSL